MKNQFSVIFFGISLFFTAYAQAHNGGAIAVGLESEAALDLSQAMSSVLYRKTFHCGAQYNWKIVHGVEGSFNGSEYYLVNKGEDDLHRSERIFIFGGFCQCESRCDKV